jgi:hypothetical protein
LILSLKLAISLNVSFVYIHNTGITYWIWLRGSISHSEFSFSSFPTARSAIYARLHLWSVRNAESTKVKITAENCKPTRVYRPIKIGGAVVCHDSILLRNSYPDWPRNHNSARCSYEICSCKKCIVHALLYRCTTNGLKSLAYPKWARDGIPVARVVSK